MRLLIDSLPETAFAPLQSPDATHEVVLVEDHVKSELPPEVTEVGFADNVSVGDGSAVTSTAVDWATVPPAPAQVIVYTYVPVVLKFKTNDPFMPRAPVHAPEAIHEVAFTENHDNVELLPIITIAGFAVNTSIGAGG
jgi:hypothetical protein